MSPGTCECQLFCISPPTKLHRETALKTLCTDVIAFVVPSKNPATAVRSANIAIDTFLLAGPSSAFCGCPTCSTEVILPSFTNLIGVRATDLNSLPSPPECTDTVSQAVRRCGRQHRQP